jgi:invasion protein IalB
VAQDAAAPQATGGQPQQPQSNWASRCVAPARQAVLECLIEQRLIMANTNQLVGSITVRIPSGDATQPVMVIQTPLGLLIPAGVSIDIDGGGKTQLQLQTCDGNGCYADVSVSDELLASLTRGEKLNIGFQNLSKQPVTITASLVGFTAAFQRIR